MKVAFAGFGHTHILSIYGGISASSEHSVVGVWESDEPTKAILQQKGIEITYTSYQDMLENSGADIIAVGSWFGERGNLIIEALHAGKHVFVDKPLCTRMQELEEIQRLVKEKDLKVGCMFFMRYLGQAQRVKQLLTDGTLGEVRTVYYGQQHPLLYSTRPAWYYQEGKHGGVINDIAIHGIELIRYLTGEQVKSVHGARCWNAYAQKEPQFADCGQFMAELSNGAGVLGDVSYAIPDSVGYSLPTYWEIFCSKGVVRFSPNWENITVYVDTQKEPLTLGMLSSAGSAWEDFMRDIHGEPVHLLDTQEVLQATRDTLLIQEFADAQR